MVGFNSVHSKESRISQRIAGGTPTGAQLKIHLEEVMRRLDAAVNLPEYARIKPLDIVVLTDGIPSESIFGRYLYSVSAMLFNITLADKPLDALEAAARKLDSAKHHPNCVGVQFVQIGSDHGAKDALELLTRGNVRVSNLSNIAYTSNN